MQSDFKWRHSRGEIILGGVRWYLKYGISYRDLEEMMLERGVELDHTTLNRWVLKYAGEIEKRLRWYWKPTHRLSWRVDETYVKVNEKWTYLYRAIDKTGGMIDFYLSSTRSAQAAKIFLGKALKRIPKWAHPSSINTDKAPSYGVDIEQLKKEGRCEKKEVHRQVKYLNNSIESDHGKLKRLIKPTLGLKSMKSAYATLKGFEVMRMFKKGQFNAWMMDKNVLSRTPSNS
jgi:IS6 family transposase